MDKCIYNALRRCKWLFQFQVVSWVIAITGGTLSAISTFVILRNCLLFCSPRNQKVQLVVLLVGLLTVGIAIATSRLFQIAIHKYNKIIEKPIRIEPSSSEEWITTVRKSITLKKLDKNVLYGHFSLHRFVGNLYIVLGNVSGVGELDYQGACIAQAKKRFHIQYHGTKEELAHILNLFIFLQNNTQEGTPQVDIDHYHEGGFRFAINLSMKNGEIQLPQMVGKIGTFIPHYLSGVKWTMQNIVFLSSHVNEQE